MTPRSDLHQLIHSTTPSERRYFRMYANMQEPNGEWNYLKLFDAVLAQKEYDEPGIKRLFADTKIAQNLAVEKHYLYMQLLKVLQQFHTRKRKEWQARELMNGVILLMERELNEPAWNLLKRLKRAAARHGLEMLSLQAHFLERRLIKRRNRKLLEKDLAVLQEEGTQVLGRLAEEMKMHDLYGQYSAELHKSHIKRKESSNEVLDRILMESQVLSPGPDASFQTRTLRLQILAGIAHQQKRVEDAYRYFRENKELWEEFPHRIAAFPLRFLKVLGNFLSAARDLERGEEFLEVLAQIKGIRVKYRLQEISGVSRELLYEMLFYGDGGDIEKARTTALELEAMLDKGQEAFSLNWLMPAAFNLCAVFFLSGELKKSLRWSQFIERLEATDKRQTLQQIAFIFQLLIHYELGNLDLLEYMVRNTKNRFKKRNQLYQFEFVVLKTLKGLLKAVDTAETNALLTGLKVTLENSFSSTMTGREEVLIWVGSRLTRDSIAAVAQKRLNK